jgi:hypothetical protein
MKETSELPPQLVIVVPLEDVQEVRGQLADAGIEAVEAETEGFDGTSVVELIVPLATLTIPAVVSMYKARVAANRSISYKSDEFEVKGVSDETLTELVKLHHQRRAAP